MEFLEAVRQVATDVATVSAKQSKKFYVIAKLKLEMMEKQSIVKNLQKQIGRDAYEAYLTESDIVEAIEDKLKKIQILEEKIDVLRRKIEQVKTEEDEIQLESFEFDEYDYEDYDEEDEDEVEDEDDDSDDDYEEDSDEDDSEDTMPLD